MKRKFVCSFLSCLLLSGCGSVMGRTSLAQGETWYPGPKTDIDVVKGDSEHDYNFVQGTLWTLDMPLSLIGDTLMLPVDYFHGPWRLQTSSASSSPKKG
ncbi:YceK/YidQ family lipoprotein [Pseudescherichia sp.]|uniref:YceK/YidQ family lipoprotein n=1 Tax=Pseudescherichia sp. TaxID=2055881 RepID=UPI0028A19CA0|nr:YceK/YidQ family lipoprotein [Pseudescherichia sp.]